MDVPLLSTHEPPLTATNIASEPALNPAPATIAGELTASGYRRGPLITSDRAAKPVEYGVDDARYPCVAGWLHRPMTPSGGDVTMEPSAHLASQAPDRKVTGVYQRF